MKIIKSDVLDNFTIRERISCDLCSTEVFHISYSFFDRCEIRGTDADGGAIFIQTDCSVNIQQCIFEKCMAERSGGAAYLCKEYYDRHVYAIDLPLQRADITYCCFSECYCYDNSRTSFVLVVSSSYTHFSFSNTKSCPGSEEDSPRMDSSQISCPGDTVNLNHLNLTEGKSKYSGAIEMFEITDLTFEFNTFIKIQGSFITYFQYMNNIVISYLNYVGNIVFDLNDSGLYPGIIFMGVGNLQIANTYFVNSIFTGRGEVAVYDKIYFDYNDNYIKLSNCYADGEKYQSDRIIVNDCNFNIPNEEITTLLIDNYNCANFYQTKTFVFSFSEKFTNSYIFTNSEKFTNSVYFSKSLQFTNSIMFTNSKDFSASDTNPSKYFSDSKSFTDSVCFSESKSFTDSEYFSDSDEFKNQMTIQISDNVVTKLSMSIIMTSMRSVSFYASQYNDFTYLLLYDKEKNTYVYIKSERYTYYHLPMIIYYLSPSYTEVITFQNLEKPKKTLSQSQLIGIVCGSIAVFFLLLYLGIFIYQKKTNRYFLKDISSDISSSSEIENEDQIKKVNIEIDTDNINNVINDDWL